MLYYAVKSVDNKPVNKIYDDWDQCKIVVWGKKAVYKSFTDRRYAEKFIVNALYEKKNLVTAMFRRTQTATSYLVNISLTVSRRRRTDMA